MRVLTAGTEVLDVLTLFFELRLQSKYAVRVLVEVYGVQTRQSEVRRDVAGVERSGSLGSVCEHIMESRSRFKEELERYRSLVASESIPTLDLPPSSISNQSSISEKPHKTSQNPSRWYQRYPASVIERFKRPETRMRPASAQSKAKSSRRPHSPSSKVNHSHERLSNSVSNATESEVAKWKEFGMLMAENYQELKKKLEVMTTERNRDQTIIAKQKEQIKKLKALLLQTQTDLEQCKASQRPEDHRCLTQLADQLISLRTDLDKRTYPKLLLDEEHLSPSSRKLSLDLDLPLNSSKSMPKLR